MRALISLRFALFLSRDIAADTDNPEDGSIGIAERYFRSQEPAVLPFFVLHVFGLADQLLSAVHDRLLVVAETSSQLLGIEGRIVESKQVAVA